MARKASSEPSQAVRQDHQPAEAEDTLDRTRADEGDGTLASMAIRAQMKAVQGRARTGPADARPLSEGGPMPVSVAGRRSVPRRGQSAKGGAGYRPSTITA